MKVLYATLIAFAAALTAVSPAKADFVSTATLTPGADGATSSNGSGMATIDYMASTQTFTYTLSWANLTGSATMAHIHDGAPGVSGPIVLPIFMSMMPATDSISGTLTQADVTPADGISTIAQVAQLIESGDAYVNIHTAAYPAGELRGQLAVSSSTSTPEPATDGLMLVSLAGGAVIAWRSRRRAA
jgi:hypothetical protein